MSDPHPTWLREPCPAWCSRPHAQADLPDDHAHTGDALPVPVIARENGVSEDGVLFEFYTAVTILLALSRRTGERLVWLNLTDEARRGFEISLDGAELLLHGLDEMVAQGRGG